MKNLICFSLVIISLLLSSTAYSTQATFTWNANSESDLSGYKLYQSDVSGKYIKGNYLTTIYAPSTTCTINVPELSLHKMIYWVLTAFDVAGNESSFSSEVNRVIPTDPGEPIVFH
jgi:hypothetical protein